MSEVIENLLVSEFNPCFFSLYFTGCSMTFDNVWLPFSRSQLSLLRLLPEIASSILIAKPRECFPHLIFFFLLLHLTLLLPIYFWNISTPLYSVIVFSLSPHHPTPDQFPNPVRSPFEFHPTPHSLM